MSNRMVQDKLVLSHGKNILFERKGWIRGVSNPLELRELVSPLENLWNQNASPNPTTDISALGVRESDDNGILIRRLEHEGYFVVDNPSAWRVKNMETRKVLASSTVSLEKVLYSAIVKLGIDPREIIRRHRERHQQLRNQYR